MIGSAWNWARQLVAYFEGTLPLTPGPCATRGEGRKQFLARGRGFETLESRQLLAAVPTGFTETRVAAGLTSPTSMDITSDGRVFVAQQDGIIRVIKNDRLLSTELGRITVDSSGERGLLGLTLDPNFDNNGYVYVYYTATSPFSHNRVSRFTVTGDRMVSGSENVLLDFGSVGDAIWRMGGGLQFGKDGRLYIGVGDQQVASNAQSLNNPYGKILRINADGSIPTFNPFYDQTTGLNRAIWAMGLRNPYTMAFQNGTGLFYINDVGNDLSEEINRGLAGRNFGWPGTEGNFDKSRYPNWTEPVYAYSHNDGCAITGGDFYNPTNANFPSSYRGKYFFADFCTGRIRTYDPVTRSVGAFASGASFPTNITVGPDGSLYYVSRGIGTGTRGTGSGQVFKIQYAAGKAPQITQAPTDYLVSLGHTATFRVDVGGSGPFTYQWQRNGTNINGATGSTYSTANVSWDNDGDRYRVIVSNAFGQETSAVATLRVTADQPPIAEIYGLPDGTLYSGGETFYIAGGGWDAEDGQVPDTNYVWQVDFHHHDHSHPFIPPTGGNSSFNFTIPTLGETSTDVWYRVYLTVTDSAGLMSTTFRDILPRTVSVEIAANIPGLAFALEGTSKPTPYRFDGVVGIERKISALTTQILNGQVYRFVSWSNGQTATHTFVTPDTDTTLTAIYEPVVRTWLSDLPFYGTPINGWGPVERDRSNGENGAGDGQAIRLNGVTFAKGLGVHASSQIRYVLGRNYSRFISSVGVDDEVGNQGSVRFLVYGDGKLLFDSGIMRGHSPNKRFDVDVSGLYWLRLVVRDGGDGVGFDHASWGGAQLLSNAASSPVPPPSGSSSGSTTVQPFARRYHYAVGGAPHSVVAGDFTGDGRADIAVANHAANNVAVLVNRGGGLFRTAVFYAVGSRPHSIRAGDLNGDGRLDLVTANDGSNNVSVLLALASGGFRTQVTYATGPVPKGVALGDVNDDGRLDIITANTAGNYPSSNNPGGDTVSILRNRGSSQFGNRTTHTTGRTPFAVVVADFNNDGKADLATANWHSGTATVLLG